MIQSKDQIEEIICKALYKFSSEISQNNVVLKEEVYYAFARHVAEVLVFEPDEEQLLDDFDDICLNSVE